MNWDCYLCDCPRPTESEGLWIVLSCLTGPDMRQADWSESTHAETRQLSGTRGAGALWFSVWRSTDFAGSAGSRR
jgi:hypothetical protein